MSIDFFGICAFVDKRITHYSHGISVKPDDRRRNLHKLQNAAGWMTTTKIINPGMERIVMKKHPNKLCFFSVKNAFV